MLGVLCTASRACSFVPQPSRLCFLLQLLQFAKDKNLTLLIDVIVVSHPATWLSS